jgi:hypothetical protein
MIVVPMTTTRLAADAAKSHVEGAWPVVFGRTPDREELALMMALVWIETARGNSIQNFNFGNITVPESYSGKAWRPPWFEVTPESSERNKSLHEAMLAGKAPKAFKAYDTAGEGALDYLAFTKRVFPNVLEAAKSGDADTFRQELAKGYSKDYENPKATATLATFQREFGGGETPRRSPGIGRWLTVAGILVTVGYVAHGTLRGVRSRVFTTGRG